MYFFGITQSKHSASMLGYLWGYQRKPKSDTPQMDGLFHGISNPSREPISQGVQTFAREPWLGLLFEPPTEKKDGSTSWPRANLIARRATRRAKGPQAPE